jgi:hypothetical protein
MTKERWRDVVGWRGWYAVSDRGRVKRVKAGPGARAGRVLRPGTWSSEHRFVFLCRGGVKRSTGVHRLVAAAFIGGNPKRHVHHIDEDPSNNFVGNLEYRKVVKHHSGHSTGEKNGRAKLTRDNVAVIRQLIRTDSTYRDIAEEFGVCIATVSHIKNGRTWKTDYKQRRS